MSHMERAKGRAATAEGGAGGARGAGGCAEGYEMRGVCCGVGRIEGAYLLELLGHPY